MGEHEEGDLPFKKTFTLYVGLVVRDVNFEWVLRRIYAEAVVLNKMLVLHCVSLGGLKEGVKNKCKGIYTIHGGSLRLNWERVRWHRPVAAVQGAWLIMIRCIQRTQHSDRYPDTKSDCFGRTWAGTRVPSASAPCPCSRVDQPQSECPALARLDRKWAFANYHKGDV